MYRKSTDDVPKSFWQNAHDIACSEKDIYQSGKPCVLKLSRTSVDLLVL